MNIGKEYPLIVVEPMQEPAAVPEPEQVPEPEEVPV